MTQHKKVLTEMKMVSFSNGMMYALTHGNWCSAKDWLPKIGNNVLVDIINAVGDKIQHEYGIAYIDQHGRWYLTNGEPVNVVNWMVLPQLPD
jgi:hypothetical protein